LRQTFEPIYQIFNVFDAADASVQFGLKGERALDCIPLFIKIHNTANHSAGKMLARDAHARQARECGARDGPCTGIKSILTHHNNQEVGNGQGVGIAPV
jgi:hypothetical protein